MEKALSWQNLIFKDPSFRPTSSFSVSSAIFNFLKTALGKEKPSREAGRFFYRRQYQKLAFSPLQVKVDQNTHMFVVSSIYKANFLSTRAL
jgi:hypothetical protein